MNSGIRETWKALLWKELFASLLLSVAVAILGIVWWREEAAFELSDLRAPDRFDDARSASFDPETLLNLYQREMAWRPLSQDTINRFLVAAHLSDNTLLVDRLAAVMGGFAWRTTAGQLNLIALKIEDRNFTEIFDHGDSLLRRGVAAEEIYALFTFYEQMPAERQRLVDKLIESPPWRQSYLASAERLLTTGQIEARYATIHQMLVKSSVRRGELASLLSRLVQIGAAKEAHDLWRMAEQPRLGGSNAAHDGDLVHATALQDAGLIVRYPFEWEFDSGRSSGAQLYRRGDEHHLELYWNGQGSPIFAKQVIKAGPERYRLTLEGVEGSSLARAAIGAELTCPNGDAVPFAPIASSDDRRLIFQTDRGAACGFPQFRLVGRGDETQRDIELTLSRIKVVALD